MRCEGRTILSLVFRQIPAKILVESVAREHPGGLPGWSAVTTSPYTKSGKIGITFFHDDWYPEEG